MRNVGGLGTAPRLRTLDPRPQTLLKDNMGWSGWEEFRNLTPNDKTN